MDYLHTLLSQLYMQQAVSGQPSHGETDEAHDIKGALLSMYGTYRELAWSRSTPGRSDDGQLSHLPAHACCNPDFICSIGKNIHPQHA